MQDHIAGAVIVQESHPLRTMSPYYRVTLVVSDMGCIDLNFDIPLSASWEYESQPRSETTSVTLYMN